MFPTFFLKTFPEKLFIFRDGVNMNHIIFIFKCINAKCGRKRLWNYYTLQNVEVLLDQSMFSIHDQLWLVKRQLQSPGPVPGLQHVQSYCLKTTKLSPLDYFYCCCSFFFSCLKNKATLPTPSGLTDCSLIMSCFVCVPL